MMQFYKVIDDGNLFRIEEESDSRIIAMNSGEFLVISEPLKPFIAKQFISVVNEQCRSDGFEVEAEYETKRKPEKED